ncbi:Polyadenylate-binding protein RBP47B [Acorus calamus]|uniref:Polyadenylate-binding protein RBP47B n=1 Tax=Acorus calamus TaxID=4465 RepID=A0AAV9CKW0_ACOCL|nr:Polyadenylate-binding protein RBP47B [Acorus calamus]
MQQRLKQQQQQQQQALMHQALLQQQQPMYHPGVLAAAMSQMEPVPSGNLPPGFDSSSCRSVYVGNIHVNVTEELLEEVFASAGALEGCKLIKKEKSSYGFVDYHDRRSAAYAIMTLHGRQLYGQPIKVNWAYASGQREDTSGHFNIFVGDLSPEITDATLFACFQVYPSCSDARVMWDHKTGCSRGFGFVSFRNQQDAQGAINDMTGKWLGNRQIRCNWASKGAGSNEDKQSNENQNAVVLTNGSSGSMDGAQNSTEEAPENNPAYTTVYVGNLAHEVTQAELHRQFHILGAGAIEEVRVQRDKGFGFVRYHSHGEAALAIQMANGRMLYGKPIKCSWGSKPTPPGATSTPLPPPVQPYQLLPTAGLNQGYTGAELLAYQRQLGLSQAANAPGLSGSALLQIAGQQSLAASGQALMGLGSGGAQAMYDGYATNSSQQMMYYQ